MRHLLLLSLPVLVLFSLISECGCGNSVTTETVADSSEVFYHRIQQLDFVQVPTQWDVEGIVDYEIERMAVHDSLDFKKHEHVVGLLKDTSRFFCVVYLAAGDALYPSIRIFRKSGEKIVDHNLAFTDCAGADCSMRDCDSYVNLDENGLTRGISYTEVECDSMSVKNFQKPYERRESIYFDSLGNMVTNNFIE